MLDTMTSSDFSAIGPWLLGLFLAAYACVVFEEKLRLSKSKPVLLAAGVMWAMIAIVACLKLPSSTFASEAFEHVFLEFAELFFFLIVAMTFVSAMAERGVFAALQSKLTSRQLNFKKLFWITGFAAFFLSPVLDNLTTALIMANVVLAIGAGNPRFIALACINVVVAANAGGAWCAFGDITTLMAWQAGKATFFQFFYLMPASLVSFVVPALCMHAAVPTGKPEPVVASRHLKYGAVMICALFALTIVITVLSKQFLHMPAVFGMLFGLGLLSFQAYHIQRRERRLDDSSEVEHYNLFEIIARAEWDTLLFFFGVLACVGALTTIGYMATLSTILYQHLGPTMANISLGLASAVVDNIPIMYAVLKMDPSMNLSQWLLITLTTGIGGSLLSVGSAAGVALMGQARGQYTFASHLRWTPAIALGFAAGVTTHLLLAPSFH
jgi:Na+/H+ antiporter NhaD/arsenite permease-like protein